MFFLKPPRLSQFLFLFLVCQGCHNNKTFKKYQWYFNTSYYFKYQVFKNTSIFKIPVVFYCQKFIFSQSEGLKSKVRGLAGLVSSEASLTSLQMASFLLCPHGRPSVCVVCVLTTSSFKNTSHIKLEPTLTTLF